MIRITFFLLLFIVNTLSLANSQPDYNEKVIYCPAQVECKNGTCMGDGENGKYFNQKSSTEETPDGIYKFKSSTLSFESNYALFQTKCNYLKNYGPFNTEVSLMSKNGFNFKPVTENWTSWKGAECIANSSEMCPFIENNALLFDPQTRQRNNHNEYGEIDYSNNPLHIKLLTEDSSLIHESHSHKIFQINYDKIIDACGAKKECTIYIEIRASDYYGQPSFVVFLGSLTIGLGEIHRIMSMTTLKSNSSFVIGTVSPMINTIIVHRK
ncbi:hypothetical protein SC807_01865 [Legionella pneumophila serogroup 1]|nr:hypothetical protein [Legionella pneumophila]